MYPCIPKKNFTNKFLKYNEAVEMQIICKYILKINDYHY